MTLSEKLPLTTLAQAQCDSLEDVVAICTEGHASRSRASHELNQDSSRSHSLLTLSIAGGGKVVLVDLAGSERLKRSKSSDTEVKTGLKNQFGGGIWLNLLAKSLPIKC